jgi:hypothetical protein
MARDDADSQIFGNTWVDRLIAINPTALEDIEQWWKETSRVPMIGSRHHTVPRFYLDRFASSDQLLLRHRVTGKERIENVSRAGTIRDFYTFINLDGEEDGRLEQILSTVESGAKEVFDRLLSPFHSPKVLDGLESMKLALFLAFQILRTPRQRRQMELMGDYVIRSLNQHVPGINDITVRPEPNFHLEYMTKAVPKMSEYFYGRPIILITLDRPLFITCDEPVILVTDGDESHIKHLPGCARTAKQRRRSARKPSRTRSRNADTVHAYPARPGAGQATEVGLTLNPRTLLVLGPWGERGPLRRAVRGPEAIALANDVNERLIEQAYDWVAANPSHKGFRELPFPSPGPIVQVCDGGTTMARDLDNAPTPRRPSLLGRP